MTIPVLLSRLSRGPFRPHPKPMASETADRSHPNPTLGGIAQTMLRSPTVPALPEGGQA
jgi:hypothetical protein